MTFTRRNRFRRRWLALGVAVPAAAASIAAALASGAAHTPPLAGVAVDRRVPVLQLENESGKATSLAAYRGRVVVLAPFLTLCHEVCPLTTGAFQQLQDDAARAGLGRGVAFAEVSVDPWRDSPARLRAFARMTGTRFPLLTGSAAQLARFSRFFGVAYRRTNEGSPPDTDWLTGKPLRFDVIHTDALLLIDARGRERIVDVGMPAIDGRLPRTLGRLLNAESRRDLSHPHAGWTLQQARDDLERLLGRRLPDA